jgi:hypothetical protein
LGIGTVLRCLRRRLRLGVGGPRLPTRHIRRRLDVRLLL